MNNPGIFIDAINPFLSVVLTTNIFILGFILVVSIYDQDKWAVLTEDVRVVMLSYIRYFIYLVLWETLIIGGVLFKSNNIDNADVFIDFIDPFLSIILITNILIALTIVVGLFDTDIWKDFPDENILKVTLSAICIYFIILIVWEIIIAAEIIFT
jgi:hypothetical protein